MRSFATGKGDWLSLLAGALLPLALAGGSFTTNIISEHFKTNCAIIQMFLDVEFKVERLNPHAYLVEVQKGK